MPELRVRICLAALAVAFVAALLAILHYGFLSGESYASLSSLRSDPEGLEILYEALGRMPARQVDRNYHPLNQASFHNTSLLIAGLQIDSGDLQGGEWFGRVEQLASEGNRVIIALQPRRSLFQQAGAHLRTVQLMKRGILLQRTSKDETADNNKTRWPIYFTASKKWTVLYKAQNRPVLVERPIGKGSLVLLADSYPLSNRAMVKDLDPSLLSSIVGANHRIVFDETHLGIVESGSLVGLARHYGLQGFMVGLFLLAGLFLWRAMSAFPPRSLDSQDEPTIEIDPLLGFSRLLARNVPANQLIPACIGEYRNVFPKALEKQPIAEFTTANKPAANPVASFREVQRRLARKTKLL